MNWPLLVLSLCGFVVMLAVAIVTTFLIQNSDDWGLAWFWGGSILFWALGIISGGYFHVAVWGGSL